MSRLFALFVVLCLASAVAVNGSTRRHRRHRLTSLLDLGVESGDGDGDAVPDLEVAEAGGDDIAEEDPMEELAEDQEQAKMDTAAECASDCSARQRELAANQILERSRMEETAEAEEKAQDFEAQYHSLEKLINHAKLIADALPEKEKRLEELRGKVVGATNVATAAEAKVELTKKRGLLDKVELDLSSINTQKTELEIEKETLLKEIKQLQEIIVKDGGELPDFPSAGSAAGSASASGSGSGSAAASGSGSASASGDGSASAAPEFRQKFDDDFMF